MEVEVIDVDVGVVEKSDGIAVGEIDGDGACARDLEGDGGEGLSDGAEEIFLIGGVGVIGVVVIGICDFVGAVIGFIEIAVEPAAVIGAVEAARAPAAESGIAGVNDLTDAAGAAPE